MVSRGRSLSAGVVRADDQDRAAGLPQSGPPLPAPGPWQHAIEL